LHCHGTSSKSQTMIHYRGIALWGFKKQRAESVELGRTLSCLCFLDFARSAVSGGSWLMSCITSNICTCFYRLHVQYLRCCTRNHFLRLQQTSTRSSTTTAHHEQWQFYTTTTKDRRAVQTGFSSSDFHILSSDATSRYRALRCTRS
jgi:hypothetical protein